MKNLMAIAFALTLSLSAFGEDRTLSTAKDLEDIGMQAFECMAMAEIKGQPIALHFNTYAWDYKEAISKTMIQLSIKIEEDGSFSGKSGSAKLEKVSMSCSK